LLSNYITYERQEEFTMKITKTTRALDALRMSPEVMNIFKKHGLYCPRCKGIGEDTIEKIAICNGMDVKDFVNELNGVLE
jgi:hypothetical protein